LRGLVLHASSIACRTEPFSGIVRNRGAVQLDRSDRLLQANISSPGCGKQAQDALAEWRRPVGAVRAQGRLRSCSLSLSVLVRLGAFSLLFSLFLPVSSCLCGPSPPPALLQCVLSSFVIEDPTTSLKSTSLCPFGPRPTTEHPSSLMPSAQQTLHHVCLVSG